MKSLRKFISEQESIVKDLLEQIMHEQKYVKYCCYCVEPKENKHTCCDEAHFIEFYNLDDDTQLQIVKDILENEQNQ